MCLSFLRPYLYRRRQSSNQTHAYSLQADWWPFIYCPPGEPEKLAEYLKYKPFGEGLGLGGVEARVYGERLTTMTPHDSSYVKLWMETGIVGLTLFLTIYISALLRGCYLIMFRIKNEELRGVLTAIACGIFGLMISAYGNAFFMQFPTGFMVILFLSVLLNGEHIDQLLTEKLRTKKQ